MLWFIVVLNNRVTQHLYQQQWDMYRTQSKHRDHRIVSISQPCARDRGRAASWANRSNLAPSSASARRASGLPISTTCAGRLSRRLGPDRVSRSLSCALQPLPGTGARRSYPQPPSRQSRLPEAVWHPHCRQAARPPKQETETNREQLKREKTQPWQENLQRISIGGKFGQGKNSYRLNCIRVKRANTSFAWINTIFLAMTLLILERIFFALSQCRLAGGIKAWLQVWERMHLKQRAQFNLNRALVGVLS